MHKKKKKPCMENNEETIAKYAVDANLFRLGSTNPKKNMQPLNVFWWEPWMHDNSKKKLENLKFDFLFDSASFM